MSQVEIALREAHEQGWGYVLASVVRSVRDLDLAEDCVQDAFVSALEHWRFDGVPREPLAWLITAAKRKAVDRIRRQQSFERKLPLLTGVEPEPDDLDTNSFPDERLRLVFTCCHPALAPESRVALTLRLICGLTTSEIARLFVVSESTMTARITRAKKKIALAGIPYRVPHVRELPQRLPAVLSAVYLVYTEGHSASSGTQLVRRELVDQALSLGRVLANLMPEQGEVLGLLALMILADARSVTRETVTEGFVPLQDQDRSLWNKDQIREGCALVERALRAPGPTGPYAIQAAIGAVHAEAASWEETDWLQVLALYDALMDALPSPIVALNRCMAVSMVHGETVALQLLDQLSGDSRLQAYPFLPALQADLYRRMGEQSSARNAYHQAIALTENELEQEFLRRRLNSLADS